MGRRVGQSIGIIAAVLLTAAGRAAPPPAEGNSVVIDRAAAGAGASAAERSAVAAFYARHAGRPVWHDASGRPTSGALAVREVLTGIEAHGLDPREYLLPAPAQGESIAADVALTVGVLRAMRHLHLGRIDPTTLGLQLPVWAEPHDFAAVLDAGLASGTPAAAMSALAPRYALYARLVDARRRYRALAEASLPPLPSVAGSIHPGDVYPGCAALDARLRAFGDLPQGSPRPAAGVAAYDGPLVAAVERFQRRHGLTPDGVLGARTVSALQVAPDARVRQISLALERLRWLPDLGARRLVAVNIPMFRLWAWDAARDDASPALAMDVIVGRAVRTQTPVFVDAMEHVIFRPYWNVPPSILREEVLPALRRDAGSLARQDMEVVRDDGDDGSVVPLDAAAFDRLAAGALRVRQRPGPQNALGLVKFMFPNSDNVYMHGTPAVGLFARNRRDFSHGCIRVADPPALAAWVLGRQRDAWPDGRIAAAMAGPDNVRVPLDQPIDVAIFYLTAAVLPEDGEVHFADDLYGHDAALGRALERRRQRE